MKTATKPSYEVTRAVVASPQPPDFSKVTERPGQKASALQLRMLAARYNWAARWAENADVLEVACGSGMGLSVLARSARSVAGGDIDETNLQEAMHTYRADSRVSLRRLDAENLPYPDGSFDLVLLFEAIYYLPDVPCFLDEAHRVLRPGGRLLIVSVNREWKGFNPSPSSVRYYSALELGEVLTEGGFTPEIQLAFPESLSPVQVWIGHIRQAAIRLNLIPRTMGSKALFKRLFYGRLEPVPARLGISGVQPEILTPFAKVDQIGAYRVMYATAQKANAL